MDLFILMVDPESSVNSDKGMKMDEVEVLGVFESEALAVHSIGLQLSDLNSYGGRSDHWSIMYYEDGPEEEPTDLLLRRTTLNKLTR